MIFNGTPINSMKVKHYEISTSDCDMIASDLQAGKTAVARGKKIVGTGKSFEFASYGTTYTNLPIPVGNVINIIELSSTIYPVIIKSKLVDINNLDFSVPQIIGTVTVNETDYSVSAVVENNFLTISCEKSISLEVFYGRDNYND